MPSVPTSYPDTPSLPHDNWRLNALANTSSDETLERNDSMSNLTNGLPSSPDSAKILTKRPPLPPHFNKRSTNKRHVSGNSSLSMRSPSPCSISSSASYRAKSLSARMRSPSVASSRSGSQLDSSSFSIPPRRTYPRENTRSPSMEKVLVKEQAPVVFDASLNFVLGCERQRVKQSFRPTASHLEPSTASSYLSSKISQFLKRTDHIMDEWRSLGHRDDANDETISLSRDKPRGIIGRSQSATNIMIRGYQYYSRASSVTKSPSRRSLSRTSEDGTLSDGIQEVTMQSENDDLKFPLRKNQRLYDTKKFSFKKILSLFSTKVVYTIHFNFGHI